MDTFTSEERCALVLSGGGGRGAFECGAIEKLAELAEKHALSWPPDVLVGTSIGAMNAAVWAIGGTAKVGEMWNQIRTRDMNRFWRLKPWNSILDRSAWKRTLETYADEKKLAQVSQKLYIVATDLNSGRPVVFNNDERFWDRRAPYRYAHLTCQKVDAIDHTHLLASSAIPYAYPKVEAEVQVEVKKPDGSTAIEPRAHKLWDGVLMYNAPLQPAIDAGATRIWVVLLSPFHERKDLPSPERGLLARIGYVIDLATMSTFENDLEQTFRRVHEELRDCKCQVIAPQEWLGVGAYFSYSKKQIEDLRSRGADAASRAWERLQKDGWDWDSARP